MFGQGQQKTDKVVERSKNTCLEHSIGKHVLQCLNFFEIGVVQGTGSVRELLLFLSYDGTYH